MLLFLLLLLTAPVADAANADGPEDDLHWTRVLDLRGPWPFRLGDDPAYAAAAYDHEAWETIFVPSPWEEEGYWGYDGVGWYRRSFRLTERQLRDPLYLRLGRVDDADQVWVNGKFLGSTGRFPESEYETGYYVHRAYRIPPGFLKPGRNVVAVRVFDEGAEGGILEGPVGLFTLDEEVDLALDLSGTWRFQPGDAGPELPRDARSVTVPAKWEPQGFPTLNNFAWYYRSFTLPDRLRGDDFVLVLGRVDDLHEVFLNGEKIGGTPRIENRYIGGNEWRELRAYRVPHTLLRGKNDLAVRVFDAVYDGGIYEGPVGLMTVSAFEQWRSGQGIFEHIREQVRAFFGLGN